MNAPLITEPDEMGAVLRSCAHSLHDRLMRYPSAQADPLLRWQWEEEARAVTREHERGRQGGVHAQWLTFIRLNQRENDLCDLEAWARTYDHHHLARTMRAAPAVGGGER